MYDLHSMNNESNIKQFTNFLLLNGIVVICGVCLMKSVQQAVFFHRPVVQEHQTVILCTTVH